MRGRCLLERVRLWIRLLPEMREFQAAIPFPTSVC